MRNEKGNALLYAEIMQRQQTPAGRKSIALARIGVHYETIRAYANGKGCNRKELAYKVGLLNESIKRLCTMHGVSREELREYFERNHYALSFKL